MPLTEPPAEAVDLSPIEETLTAALATKVNVSDLEPALATKVNVSDFEPALATKVNVSDLEPALATKVNVSDFETALQDKASSATLTELQSSLESKVSGDEMSSFVTTQIAQHVSASDPHSQYVLDADLIAALATKADVGTTGTSLGDPAPAIGNPDTSLIDATYGAEEAQVLSTMRTALNKVLDVLRAKNLIKASLVFTVSQSSAYTPTLVATYANLTDGDPGTGAGTNSGTSWVQADFGAPITISAVSVAGGSLPGWGGVAAYLNGAYIQTSLDGTNWTDKAIVSGITDSGATRVGTFSFAPVSARYVRIYANSYLSTTELGFA